MELQVSLLDPGPTSHGTFNLKLANYLIEAHIGLEPMRQILLTVGAHFLPQRAEAGLADDSAALLAIKWRFW